MAEYLAVRRSLIGVVLLIDSRHGFTDIDSRLLEFIAPRLAGGAVKLFVLLTKVDKLNRREAVTSTRSAEAMLASVPSAEADISLSTFSALNGDGVSDVARALREWTTVAEAHA